MNPPARCGRAWPHSAHAWAHAYTAPFPHSGPSYYCDGKPMEATNPTTQCVNEQPHPAHDWILDTGGVENHRHCPGRTVPAAHAQGRPTRAVALMLFAQPGDIVTWGDLNDVNARYRWDGETWQPLQVGDVCRNARDGSAIIWGGPVAGWRKPHVSRADVDELAAVLDPEYPNYSDEQAQVSYVAALAERALAHGYIHTLRAPAVQPASYHFPRVPYQAGDPVDVTWSNGRTTRHIIEAVSPEGVLTMRNRE